MPNTQRISGALPKRNVETVGLRVGMAIPTERPMNTWHFIVLYPRYHVCDTNNDSFFFRKQDGFTAYRALAHRNLRIESAGSCPKRIPMF